MTAGHRVLKRDQKRIKCQHGKFPEGKCGKPAVYCHHNHFNTFNGKSVAFHYVCEEHRNDPS